MDLSWIFKVNPSLFGFLLVYLTDQCPSGKWTDTVGFLVLILGWVSKDCRNCPYCLGTQYWGLEWAVGTTISPSHGTTASYCLVYASVSRQQPGYGKDIPPALYHRLRQRGAVCQAQNKSELRTNEFTTLVHSLCHLNVTHVQDFSGAHVRLCPKLYKAHLSLSGWWVKCEGPFLHLWDFNFNWLDKFA